MDGNALNPEAGQKNLRPHPDTPKASADFDIKPELTPTPFPHKLNPMTARKQLSREQIRSLRGKDKSSTGGKSYAERMADLKREELALEEAKIVRMPFCLRRIDTSN